MVSFSSTHKIPQDWFSSVYAQRYFQAERPHIEAAIRQAIGPKVLQVGSLLEQRLVDDFDLPFICLLYTSPSPRDQRGSRMPSSD